MNDKTTKSIGNLRVGLLFDTRREENFGGVPHFAIATETSPHHFTVGWMPAVLWEAALSVTDADGHPVGTGPVAMICRNGLTDQIEATEFIIKYPKAGEPSCRGDGQPVYFEEFIGAPGHRIDKWTSDPVEAMRYTKAQLDRLGSSRRGKKLLGMSEVIAAPAGH